MSNLIGLSAYNEQHSFEKRKFWQHNSLEYLQLRYSEIFYLWCYQWFACCQIPEWCYWTHERITRLESTPKIVLRPLMVKAFHYSTMTWHKWKTHLNPLYKLLLQIYLVLGRWLHPCCTSQSPLVEESNEVEELELWHMVKGIFDEDFANFGYSEVSVEGN